MWKYMQSNVGKHRHTALGRTSFVNASRMAAPTDDEAKDWAVRKLVRTIIEGNGEPQSRKMGASRAPTSDALDK